VANPPRPHDDPLATVFLTALRLGLTSFGGPIAHISYFRAEYVDRRRWLDDARFADLVALVQALPGPASSQLGIAIGTLRAGRLGGLAAWLGFTLPSAILLTALALVASDMELTGAAWIDGLKVAAVAVVTHAVIRMWRTLAPDLRRSVLVIGAALLVLAVPSPVTQVAVIVLGGVVGRALLAPAPVGAASTGSGPGSRTAGLVTLGVFGLLLVGLPVLRQVDDGQVVATVDAFYRAGALVFGGGHVVLPLLHEEVVPPGWVTEDRFLAGYGAAQAVPGPLFTFAAYLGASSTLAPGGVAGATIALVAIFLPSFLLVWGVLPIWERLRDRTGVRRALTGVQASVVGLLLAALVDPVVPAAVTEPVRGIVAVVLAMLLLVTRVPAWAVVGLGVVAMEVVGRVT
jgi:chromate transporter